MSVAMPKFSPWSTLKNNLNKAKVINNAFGLHPTPSEKNKNIIVFATPSWNQKLPSKSSIYGPLSDLEPPQKNSNHALSIVWFQSIAGFWCFLDIMSLLRCRDIQANSEQDKSALAMGTVVVNGASHLSISKRCFEQTRGHQQGVHSSPVREQNNAAE